MVAPCRTSPVVVPVQVVVEPGPVTAEQAVKKVSPAGLAVVGSWMAGIPARAPGGAVAVTVNTPELVLVQVPVTPPATRQVPPTTVVQGTPGVPDGGRTGKERVGVGVRVRARTVAVAGRSVGVAVRARTVAVAGRSVGVAVRARTVAVAGRSVGVAVSAFTVAVAGRSVGVAVSARTVAVAGRSVGVAVSALTVAVAGRSVGVAVSALTVAVAGRSGGVAVMVGLRVAVGVAVGLSN